MSKHFGAVEADFQGHYGLDLREVLWGARRAGVRRILALVDGLPPNCATARAITSKGRDWTTTDELLATLIEVTDMTNSLIYTVNSKKGAMSWKPVIITRPTDEIVKRKPSSPEAVRQFFRGKNVKLTGGED